MNIGHVELPCIFPRKQIQFVSKILFCSVYNILINGTFYLTVHLHGINLQNKKQLIHYEWYNKMSLSWSQTFLLNNRYSHSGLQWGQLIVAFLYCMVVIISENVTKCWPVQISSPSQRWIWCQGAHPACFVASMRAHS